MKRRKFIRLAVIGAFMVGLLIGGGCLVFHKLSRIFSRGAPPAARTPP